MQIRVGMFLLAKAIAMVKVLFLVLGYWWVICNVTFEARIYCLLQQVVGEVVRKDSW